MKTSRPGWITTDEIKQYQKEKPYVLGVVVTSSLINYMKQVGITEEDLLDDMAMLVADLPTLYFTDNSRFNEVDPSLKGYDFVSNPQSRATITIAKGIIQKNYGSTVMVTSHKLPDKYYEEYYKS